MHTPEDFLRDFIYNEKSTQLQKKLLWRQRWAGTAVNWDSAKLLRVIDLKGRTIYMHAAIKSDGRNVHISAFAPMERAALLGQFSSGDYVRISGTLADEYNASKNPWDIPGGSSVQFVEASLSRGTLPPPPVVPGPIPTPKHTSGGCLFALVFIPGCIAAVLYYALLSRLLKSPGFV